LIGAPCGWPETSIVIGVGAKSAVNNNTICEKSLYETSGLNSIEVKRAPGQQIINGVKYNKNWLLFIIRGVIMQLLTLEQFRSTNDAGGVLSVTLKAEGTGFEMQIETRRGMAKLVKSRDKSEMRRFIDLRKALLLLRDLGILEARIDSQKWRPEDHEFERKPRPDRAEVMTAAHEALSHTDWLHEKLTKSAAGTRPHVSHEQVMSEAQAIIDKKRQVHAEKSPS